ncbi:MAG: hypothetical protein MI742_07380, partial [Desulfobacterales bacterium]|nr:hypothetical protein [Desulfobacterales bacterium]
MVLIIPITLFTFFVSVPSAFAFLDLNLGDGEVTTRAIRDGAITTQKLGNSAVTTGKIAGSAVSTDK